MSISNISDDYTTFILYKEPFIFKLSLFGYFSANFANFSANNTYFYHIIIPHIKIPYEYRLKVVSDIPGNIILANISIEEFESLCMFIHEYYKISGKE